MTEWIPIIGPQPFTCIINLAVFETYTPQVARRAIQRCHTQWRASFMMLLSSKVLFKTSYLLKVKGLKILLLCITFTASQRFSHRINCGLVLAFSLL